MAQVKLWGAAGIIVLILVALFFSYNKGYNAGKMVVEAKYAKARESAQSKANKVERDVVRKTDKELYKALEKWFRD